MEQMNPLVPKYRVSCCTDFPNADPTFIPVYNMAEAMEVLRGFSAKGQFHSEQFPNPGLQSIAFIEYWDEQEKDWLFVPEGYGVPNQ